ncbi:hypothetical protein OUZ56_015069 [Daphnia magna]|uniref:Uncharacterized protein n=1 Tax=Daphnia magna TaxID=35525 RepID=A0ABR0ALP8_9CRUS|nr:hypothetical protein OUZ56_015069 [Daphnia magna]
MAFHIVRYFQNPTVFTPPGLRVLELLYQSKNLKSFQRSSHVEHFKMAPVVTESRCFIQVESIATKDFVFTVFELNGCNPNIRAASLRLCFYANRRPDDFRISIHQTARIKTTMFKANFRISVLLFSIFAFASSLSSIHLSDNVMT